MDEAAQWRGCSSEAMIIAARGAITLLLRLSVLIFKVGIVVRWWWLNVGDAKPIAQPGTEEALLFLWFAQSQVVLGQALRVLTSNRWLCSPRVALSVGRDWPLCSLILRHICSRAGECLPAQGLSPEQARGMLAARGALRGHPPLPPPTAGLAVCQPAWRCCSHCAHPVWTLSLQTPLWVTMPRRWSRDGPRLENLPPA